MNKQNNSDISTPQKQGKKPYSSPRLIHHGLVRELTASGSNPNTEQGELVDASIVCSQDARSTCLP